MKHPQQRVYCVNYATDEIRNKTKEGKMDKCINCEKNLKYPYMIIVNHNNDEEYKSCFDCGNNKQYEIDRKIKEKKDE